MDTSKKSETYHCNYCHKEIPASAALTPEGRDYAYHFCGQDCYSKWKEEKK